MKNFTLAILLMFSSIAVTAQQNLSPVDAGSNVHFVIRNLGFKTGGDFTGLKGTIKFNPSSIAQWSFDVTVQSATIDTDNGTRDGHLKKAEYFDVAAYPEIKLESTKIENAEEAGVYIFKGKLTIKGVTKDIEFPFKVNKKDGGYLFTGQFDLNRRDFNVGGNSISLSDNLNVQLNVLAK